MDNLIIWPKGLQPFYNKVKQHQEIIRTGIVLAIDPSSASAASMPGFAIFNNSELVLKGTIKINHKQIIYHRLTELYHKIQELIDAPPDVLVIETVNKQQGHIFLLWAVGVSIAAAKAPIVFEEHNCLWKAVAKATPGYTKSDANDAEMIGWALIKAAQREK